MAILFAVGLTLFSLIALVAVVIGLPGTWMMAAATALVAWLRWDAAHGWNDQMIGGPVLLLVLALAILGEIVEFAAGAAGAKKAGASRRGAIGALLGALVGGILGAFVIPIPLVGSLIGACVGAALGAFVLELSGGRRWNDAYRSGVGAGIGRLQGTLAKLAVAIAMFMVIAIAAFWP